jgi:hypothetical protein
LWRCGDGLFLEVCPLASDALLTTLHPLLENVNKFSRRRALSSSRGIARSNHRELKTALTTTAANIFLYLSP